MSTISNIGILEWENEAGGSAYPLSQALPVLSNVIVDGYWFTFDGIVPSLLSIESTNDSLVFVVDTYFGQLSGEWVTTDALRVDFYDTTANRLAGRVILGSSAAEFQNTYIGQTLAVGLSFDLKTIASFNSSSGVFSVQGAIGDVSITTDQHIGVSVSNSIHKFDSVGIPACDDTLNPLLSMNGMTAPSMTLELDSFLLITPKLAGIQLDLATGGLSGTTIHTSTNG